MAGISIPDMHVIVSLHLTFSNWTKDINQQLEEQLLERILDLYLQCKTHEDIAREQGFKSHTTSVDKIAKIKQILEELSKNPISDLATEYPNFAEKTSKMSAFQPLIYNIWNVSKNNNETKHFGNVPTALS